MAEQVADNPLDHEPFSYRQFKNGNVSIYFNEREVTILKGKKAQRFVAQTEIAAALEAQMIMAKITGNFKRGNERVAKEKDKRQN